MSARQIPIGAPAELPKGAEVYKEKRRTVPGNTLAPEQPGRIGWYMYQGRHVPYQWDSLGSIWRVVRSHARGTPLCCCDCGECHLDDHDHPNHPQHLLRYTAHTAGG